jgi:hypothetical protein
MQELATRLDGLEQEPSAYLATELGQQAIERTDGPMAVLE